MLCDPLLCLTRGSLTGGGSLCRGADCVTREAFVRLPARGFLDCGLGLLAHYTAYNAGDTFDAGICNDRRLIQRAARRIVVEGSVRDTCCRVYKDEIASLDQRTGTERRPAVPPTAAPTPVFVATCAHSMSCPLRI